MSKKKAPKSTELALASAGEIDATWRQWASIATEAEKSLLHSMVHSHDLSTSVGIIMLSQDMIARQLDGTISPAVAMACLPWIEVIATQVQLANVMNGVAGGKSSVVAVALENKQRIKLKASFTREEPQVISLPVPEEAKEVK